MCKRRSESLGYTPRDERDKSKKQHRREGKRGLPLASGRRRNCQRAVRRVHLVRTSGPPSCVRKRCEAARVVEEGEEGADNGYPSKLRQ